MTKTHLNKMVEDGPFASRPSTFNAEEYKQIIPASDGWYYVWIDDPDEDQKYSPIVRRVAVWALTEYGVVGLLSTEESKNTSGVCLEEPPPVPGGYKHLSELTKIEKNMIGNSF